MILAIYLFLFRNHCREYDRSSTKSYIDNDRTSRCSRVIVEFHTFGVAWSSKTQHTRKPLTIGFILCHVCGFVTIKTETNVKRNNDLAWKDVMPESNNLYRHKSRQRVVITYDEMRRRIRTYVFVHPCQLLTIVICLLFYCITLCYNTYIL